MSSKYDRSKQWLSKYQESVPLNKKPFSGKVAMCMCEECWFAGEDYKLKWGYENNRPYNRTPNDWLFYMYDSVHWVFREYKFTAKTTQRMDKNGFSLGYEGGKYFERF